MAQAKNVLTVVTKLKKRYPILEACRRQECTIVLFVIQVCAGI